MREGPWHLPFLGNPPILPGLLVALLVATLLFRSVAPRLGIGRIRAWLLIVAVGAILVATMTPLRNYHETGATGVVACDLSRIGPAPLSEYLRFDDPMLNILLFMPLGMLLGSLTREQHRRGLIVAAIALPFAIEATQAVLVPLGRACESGDIFDNLAGLAIGLAGGWLAGALWRRELRPVQA